MRKEGEGLCPSTPLGISPQTPRLGSVFRRGGNEAFTTGESPPLLNTLQNQGSKDLSLAGVQGAAPPGLTS
jgi:hypothetical protein